METNSYGFGGDGFFARKNKIFGFFALYGCVGSSFAFSSVIVNEYEIAEGEEE